MALIQPTLERSHGVGFWSLVSPPELLLRVDHLGRQCARGYNGPVGLDWVGPVVLLYRLFRVTGIPATEAQALRSRTDYAEYQRDTSVFVPLPPRQT